MKIIPSFIKKKYVEFYSKSRVFRNFINSLGIGLGTSFFYGASGGACPCCGKGATTCAVGVSAIGIVGLVLGTLSFVFLTLKDSYGWIKSKVGWKEKKLSK